VTGLSRFSYSGHRRSSTLRFTSETSDVRAIGKESAARYVMKAVCGKRVRCLRVAVQLVGREHGAHLWAESYDRQFARKTFSRCRTTDTAHCFDRRGSARALVHSMSESLRAGALVNTPRMRLCCAHSLLERSPRRSTGKSGRYLKRRLPSSPATATAWPCCR